MYFRASTHAQAGPLWDRSLLVAFSGCLLLLLHALAGLGESPVQDRLHTPGSYLDHPKFRRHPWDDDAGHTPTIFTENRSKPDMIRHYSSAYFPTVAAAPSPIPTSVHTTSSDRYDPFDLDPFFDTDEYDNDGQPFALKIRVKHSDVMQKGAERCQASGGLRCNG